MKSKVLTVEDFLVKGLKKVKFNGRTIEGGKIVDAYCRYVETLNKEINPKKNYERTQRVLTVVKSYSLTTLIDRCISKGIDVGLFGGGE